MRNYSAMFRNGIASGYAGRWEPLSAQAGCGGAISIMRPSVVQSAGVAAAVARDALVKLLGTPNVDAFGAPAPAALATLLRQMAYTDRYDDRECALVVHAADRSMRLLKAAGASDVRVEDQYVEDEFGAPRGAFDPCLPLFDGERFLELPDRPFQYRHPDRGARPHRVVSEGYAHHGGTSVFESIQYLYTYADDSAEDKADLRRGTAPSHYAPSESLSDGTLRSVFFPTLMVHRLTPRSGTRGYTNVRFGINFATGGDFLVGLSSKKGDLDEFLAFYPPAFASALDVIMPEAGAR